MFEPTAGNFLFGYACLFLLSLAADIVLFYLFNYLIGALLGSLAGADSLALMRGSPSRPRNPCSKQL